MPQHYLLHLTSVVIAAVVVSVPASADGQRGGAAAPTRVGRPSPSQPVSLQEIRRRARERSRERTRRARRAAAREQAQAGPRAGDTERREALKILAQDLGPAYEPLGSGKLVNLNFTDMGLGELIRSINLATGRRIIISSKLGRIKASIFSPRPVTAAEAFQAFLSVLAANDMTVVPSGRFLKVTQVRDAASLSVPVCIDGEACVRGERMVTRLHRLRHGDADDMAQLLVRFKSSHADITAFAPTNTLIVTDYARNVRRLIRLTHALQERSADTHIWVEPVFHGSAPELVDVLTQLFEPTGPATAQRLAPRAKRRRGRARRRGRRQARNKARNSKAAVIGAQANSDRLEKLLADERTNQLIIVATEQAYLKLMPVLRLLDVPESESGERGIHVHQLEHADAEELASTLSSLVTDRQQRGRRRRRRKLAPRSKALARAFDGDVTVTSDKATNSLIITGSARDYANLRFIINELDVDRLQVFVEAAILEVSLETQRRLGVAAHGGAPLDVETGETTGQGLALLGTSFDGGQLNSLILDPSMLQGLALGLRGPEIEGSEESDVLPAGISIPAFGVVLQALQTSSDVNVLSTPHVLAMDHEEAEINVGQNVPVSNAFAGGGAGLSSLLGGASSSAMGGLFPSMAVGRQDVGIKLTITPHINQSAQVRLEAQLEVSEVAGESDMGPIIGQRMAKTICVLDDQQTVVLGGLVTDNVVDGVQKVPVLGDIPLLGRLFKRTTKRTTKRNLLVLLTPRIVRDSEDFRRIFSRRLQARREFIARHTAFEDHEVDVHLDYERTNGLVEEIRQAVEEVDEQERLERLLEGTDPPQHRPRPPVTPDRRPAKTLQ